MIALRRGRLAAAALAFVVLAGCQADVGATSCPDWLAGSSTERTAAFHDALEARNLELTGPAWQADLSVAMAESYCRSSPNATLDDALDFIGAPEGARGMGRGARGALFVVVVAAAGILARGHLQTPAGVDGGLAAVDAASDGPGPGDADRQLLELLRDVDGSVESAAQRLGDEIDDDVLRRLLEHGLIEMDTWDHATVTSEGDRFLADPDARLSTAEHDDEAHAKAPPADVTFSEETGCFTAKLGQGVAVFDETAFDLELPGEPTETVALEQVRSIEVETGMRSAWLRFTFDEHSQTVAFPAHHHGQAREIADALRNLAERSPRRLQHGEPDP